MVPRTCSTGRGLAHSFSERASWLRVSLSIIRTKVFRLCSVMHWSQTAQPAKSCRLQIWTLWYREQFIDLVIWTHVYRELVPRTNAPGICTENIYERAQREPVTLQSVITYLWVWIWLHGQRSESVMPHCFRFIYMILSLTSIGTVCPSQCLCWWALLWTMWRTWSHSGTAIGLWAEVQSPRKDKIPHSHNNIDFIKHWHIQKLKDCT